MQSRPRRVVLLGDLHCGHRAGLCPPAWWSNPKQYPAVRALQEETWALYRALVVEAGRVDAVVCNGDAIDGRGERSGSTELLTTDRMEQVEIAAACLKAWRPARGYRMTYGTPYHTGDAEDYESALADKLGCEVKAHLWLDVDGCVLDCKHHVGGSSVPHGRHTAVARERLWNLLWEERALQPRAQLVARSHVHYHAYSGAPGWVAMTLPALQAAHTKYGARRCAGTVDWGIVIVDCQRGRVTAWRALTHQLRSVAERAIRL